MIGNVPYHLLVLLAACWADVDIKLLWSLFLFLDSFLVFRCVCGVATKQTKYVCICRWNSVEKVVQLDSHLLT
jgi:hypothetical protein